MKTARRTLIALFLGAISLMAEPVWFSPHGKTFHTNQSCMSLARTKSVLTADRTEATAHGLHECSICSRKKTDKRADNSAWGKATK